MRTASCLYIPKYFEELKELLLSDTNVYGVNDVRQTEMRKAEPLVPKHSSFAVEISIAQLKTLPRSDRIPAQLIQAGGDTLHSKNHKLNESIWNKEELP